ncbi:hypothetical protein PIB30_097202 [Stylosanthes scabra]|uniref:Uncharacterized protein n=1 Tax=Stylosanthes scabra TaxID=79078 RepID=A0ABU6TWY9_9FABA|nr:hypothetical protein [Stylosanthes scabra]
MDVNRQTDENGKPVVPILGDDPYSWVKGSQLKCAPSQIHPNAWAFIRGFEGRTLFMLYKSSYKDFKRMFVKVSSVEEKFPFYNDECLLERFPLYWYSEPVQILGMTDVNEESSLVIDFLDQYLCTKEPLSLNRLVKWEKEKDSISEYLDMSTWGLKNFFKWKNEKELSTSNAVKTEQVVVVNQPSKRKNTINIKRKRQEEVMVQAKGKVVDLTESRCCGKEISLEEVKRFTENQRKLHGYVGEEELTSVWSEHYPLSVVAEEHFPSKTDFDLIESVDDIARAQFMQVYAARLLCIGRYDELKSRKEVEQKKEESAELQKNMEREKKLQLAVEQVALKEKEVLDLKSENEELKRKVEKLEKDKTGLEARVVKLCVQKKEAETSKEHHGYEMLSLLLGLRGPGSKLGSSSQK